MLQSSFRRNFLEFLIFFEEIGLQDFPTVVVVVVVVVVIIQCQVRTSACPWVHMSG